MNFFNKLFGKGAKKEPTRTSNSSPQKNYFITNSAEAGFGDIKLAIAGKLRVDALLAIAALEDYAKKTDHKLSWQVMYTTLLEEGALTVPVVFDYAGQGYSLYFIYQEQDLLKYKDLEVQVKRTKYPNLIYFSSIPIFDGYKPQKIVEPFQLADLRFEKNAKVAGEYAMWWSTSVEPRFIGSKTFNTLSKIYEVFFEYESYLTGYLLRQIRFLQETKLQRMALPNEENSFVVQAPENKKVIIALSQEKGVRFLFPVKDTSVAYRERFLKGVLVDLLAMRIPLEQQGTQKDAKTDPNGTEWFRFMSRVLQKQEQEGEVSMVGGMNINIRAN